jgi:isopentenyldiphosphate isomerase
MAAADELVEVVDEHGAVERVVTRADMRARNLRHRMVAVAVVTGAGEVVAHRRADWKDIWPGRWDVCFGGIPGVGEDWRVAAVRELAEEAGVAVDPSALRELGRGTYADGEVTAVAHVFLAEHDGPFDPVDGEVAELAVVPLAGLDAWLAGRPLCADSETLVIPRLRGLVPRAAPSSTPAASDTAGDRP